MKIRALSFLIFFIIIISGCVQQAPISPTQVSSIEIPEQIEQPALSEIENVLEADISDITTEDIENSIIGP